MHTYSGNVTNVGQVTCELVSDLDDGDLLHVRKKNRSKKKFRGTYVNERQRRKELRDADNKSEARRSIPLFY